MIIRQYKRLADFSSTSLTCEENCQGEFNKQVWDLQNQLDLGDFEFFFHPFIPFSSQVWTGHPKVDRTLWNPECWRSFRIIQSHSCHFETGCNMNFRFIMDRQAEHRLRSHWPVSMLPDALDASSILFPNSPISGTWRALAPRRTSRCLEELLHPKRHGVTGPRKTWDIQKTRHKFSLQVTKRKEHDRFSFRSARITVLELDLSHLVTPSVPQRIVTFLHVAQSHRSQPSYLSYTCLQFLQFPTLRC